MSYHGDIRLGETIDLKFSTVSTSAVPTTLAGTPSVAAYVGNGTTEITAGITLTVDFDGRTGYHNVRVVATSGNGYATATNVSLCITAGTVGGVSVVGIQVGSFSIENRSAVMPTVAARTLDVTATGAAGIDWGNVENPTTALNLSATNIDVDQVVASVSGAVGSVTGAVGSVTGNVGGNVTGSVGSVVGAVGSVTGNVGGNVVGSVASVTARVTANTDQLAGQTVTAAAGVTFPTSVASPTNITAGTITTVTNLTNAPTNGDFTNTMKTSIGTAVAASAVASVTGNVGGNVNGNVVGDVQGNVDGSVDSVTQMVDANIEEINGTTVNGDGAGTPWGP